MMDINKKITEIIAKYNVKIEKICKERDRCINKLTKNYIFCPIDKYAKVFSKSENKIIEDCIRGCNDYIKKKDFYKIEVEDYIINIMEIGALSQDDDILAIEHRIETYNVCPKCGRMSLLDIKILEKSDSWFRYVKNKFPNDFIPNDWKQIIRIIK